MISRSRREGQCPFAFFLLPLGHTTCPPQRPPLNNMPRRQSANIGDRCPIERVSPNHVPPVPSNLRRGRPCACPRTPSNQRTPAWRLPCVSPIAGKQFQPLLAFFPRQTVPTPKLGCTRRRVQSTNVSARMHAAKAEDKVRSRSCLCSVAILLACLNVTIHSTALGMFTFRFLSHPQIQGKCIKISGIITLCRYTNGHS